MAPLVCCLWWVGKVPFHRSWGGGYPRRREPGEGERRRLGREAFLKFIMHSIFSPAKMEALFHCTDTCNWSDILLPPAAGHSTWGSSWGAVRNEAHHCMVQTMLFVLKRWRFLVDRSYSIGSLEECLGAPNSHCRHFYLRYYARCKLRSLGPTGTMTMKFELSLLALRLAVREIGLPPPPILYQNPRLVPRIVY